MRAPVMAALSDRLDAVADAVPWEAPIIYFDVPVHFNIGDLLILAGTETWLKRHGRRVTHRFSVRDYRRFLQSVTEDHVLLFHGGGNMGDLWREHEALRQDVLRRFPRNKAVLLPQTVHFRNAQAAKACGAAYREHADCTVFVLDDTSRRLVEEQMHAAILGCLLGKEVTIVDNSYGKLSSYFDTWMPGMIPRAGACALDPRL